MEYRLSGLTSHLQQICGIVKDGHSSIYLCLGLSPSLRPLFSMTIQRFTDNSSAMISLLWSLAFIWHGQCFLGLHFWIHPPNTHPWKLYSCLQLNRWRPYKFWTDSFRGRYQQFGSTSWFYGPCIHIIEKTTIFPLHKANMGNAFSKWGIDAVSYVSSLIMLIDFAFILQFIMVSLVYPLQ